jgi:hypothetical protein
MEIFIGSSRESVDLVREIEVWLEEHGHQPTPWDNLGLFPPGEQTLNILIGISRRVEGAIFVFNADDKIWYRSDSVSQPRDNVLIEYGLFAGALGPTKAIICRNGNPKQAVDLHGLTFIDISEQRRARAKLEISIWARNLASNLQDPALLHLQARVAELEREREQLTDKLSFESDKARELGQILTDKDIIDFTSYDLITDGHWKLLFEYRYFNRVAEHISRSVKSPNELKHLLESSLSSKIARAKRVSDRLCKR